MSCPNGGVSWFPKASLQSLKLSPDLRISLPANEIGLKFYGAGQIIVCFIKAEPKRKFYKTPGIVIIDGFATF